MKSTLQKDRDWDNPGNAYKVSAFGAAPPHFFFGTEEGYFVWGATRTSLQKLHLSDRIVQVAASSMLKVAAFATSTGKVGLLDFGRDSTVEMYDTLDGETVSALEFHNEMRKLFLGTGSGMVYQLEFEVSDNVQVTRILELRSSIVQISAWKAKLIVSSELKTVICDSQAKSFREVGIKTRRGAFGAIISLRPDSELNIYCARPGTRIWRSNLEGEVEETLQLREILQSQDGFSKMFYLADTDHLITYSSSAVHVIDPNDLNNSTSVKFVDGFVDGVCAFGSSIYVLTSGEISKYNLVFPATASEMMPTEDLIAAYEEIDGKKSETTRSGRGVGESVKSLFSKTAFVNPIVSARVAYAVQLPTTAASQREDVTDGEKESDTLDDYFGDIEEMFHINEEHYSMAAEYLSKRTKQLIQKTGEKLKQLPVGASTDSDDDEATRQTLEEKLKESAEYLLSFDRAEDERNEELIAAVRKFLAAREELRDFLAARGEEGNEPFAAVEDRAVIEDVLEMIVRKRFLSLLPAEPVEGGETATDMDISGVDLTQDLRTLGVMSAHPDMFSPRKMLSAIPDSYWNCWQYVLQSMQDDIRSKFAAVSLVNRKEDIDAILANEVVPGDRLAVLAYAFHFVRQNPGTARRLVSINLPCLRHVDLFFLYRLLRRHDDDDRETNDEFLLRSISSMVAEHVDSKTKDDNDPKVWLSKRPSTVMLLADLFRDHCKKTQSSDVDMAPLGFILSELVPAGPERTLFCKECEFWPGYVKSLRLLEDRELLWEEIETIMDLGDAKLISFLGLLGSYEDCRRVLFIRSQQKGQHNQGTIKWDTLGLEILKNLGVDEGKRVLLDSGKHLPKGSFSAMFYREVIRMSFLSN